MTKRIKPVLTIPTITTLEEADATLAQIAAKKRELDLLELGLKERIDSMKLKCAEESEPIRQDIEALEQSLVRFGESKKAELFGRKRSRLLTFGTLGFRASSSIKPMRKTTWGQVLGFLKGAGLTHCIRVKEDVDKDALRQLSEDKLAEVGCRLERSDVFFYELAETRLTEAGDQ